MINTQKIKLVPFTTEELEDVQLTLVDKMLELNRISSSSTSDYERQEVTKEITRLGKVQSKVSNYAKIS